MSPSVRRRAVMASTLVLMLAAAQPALAQAPSPATPAAEAGLTAQGEMRFEVGGFRLGLSRASQTVTALAPVGVEDFDFTPVDRLAERAGDGHVHLGDLNLKVRRAGQGAWSDHSTFLSRRPVRALAAGGAVLAAADITPAFGEGLPIRVERQWVNDDGALAVRFILSNPGAEAVEVGALGLPMVFDNMLTGRDLTTAHARNSLVDPSIAMDAGYVQVTRLNGQGPALLVLPEAGSPLRSWRPVLEQPADQPPLPFRDRTRRTLTFEGFHEWMVADAAFAEPEREAGQPWNPRAAFTLAPGESRAIGLRFVLSPSVRDIESILIAQGHPVAAGLPGYVLAEGQAADLWLRASSDVRAVTSHPAGALSLESAEGRAGWARYRVTGHAWGRARAEIAYADGAVQTVQYFVTKPAEQVMDDLGRFLTTQQWFDDPADPFGRGPSVISYDRDAGQVLQEHRVWIAGLSDEAGAGSWLAAFMKQLLRPEAGEIDRLERFVDETLHGRLQITEGDNKFGVKKSLFLYDPAAFPGYYDAGRDWTTWASWNREGADSVGRSFNYVHPAAAYWSFYRLARNFDGLVTNRDWRWYLTHAYETAMAMPRLAPHYAQFGQMEGTVFVDILKDLRREGMDAQADALEGAMRARADHWRTQPYPFGSEMPWDSTGQEEVYAWMRHFGHEDAADLTREVIVAYTPSIPGWGYNGAARRYWDFQYAGKVPRIERMLHHYGSSLNAIPLLDAYRSRPDDLHLLRAGYGGIEGSRTNIDRDGFGSVAFHSFPDIMDFDAYTGDYGSNVFGQIYAAASYLVRDPAFGWIGFGGVVEEAGDVVRFTPTDAGRSRLYVAPAGLWLTLDAGRFAGAEYEPATGAVRVILDPADVHTPMARLRIEQPARAEEIGVYRPTRSMIMERGAHVARLGEGATTLELRPSR